MLRVGPLVVQRARLSNTRSWQTVRAASLHAVGCGWPVASHSRSFRCRAASRCAGSAGVRHRVRPALGGDRGRSCVLRCWRCRWRRRVFVVARASQDRQRRWLITILVASLTGALGCIGLEAAGVLSTLVALVASATVVCSRRASGKLTPCTVPRPSACSCLRRLPRSLLSAVPLAASWPPRLVSRASSGEPRRVRVSAHAAPDVGRAYVCGVRWRLRCRGGLPDVDRRRPETRSMGFDRRRCRSMRDGVDRVRAARKVRAAALAAGSVALLAFELIATDYAVEMMKQRDTSPHDIL